MPEEGLFCLPDHHKVETWRTSDRPHDSSVKVLDFPTGHLQLHVYSLFQSVSITKIKDRKTEVMLIVPK